MSDALDVVQREVEDLLQFIYLMPVAVVRLGPAGDVQMINPKAVQLLQDLDVDVGRASGLDILDALLPGTAAQWRASAGRVGAVMPPQRCSPAAPGRAAQRHLMLQLVRTDLDTTMLAIEDATTTVEQEREISRQRRRLAIALEHIRGYGVVMLDGEGGVIESNPSIERLLQRSEAELLGRPLLQWLATPAEPAMDFKHIRQSVAGQGWCQLQAAWQRTDDASMWGDCVFTPLTEPDGSAGGYVAVIRDVTEDRAREQQLLDAALTDPLTGLYNRRGLETRVAPMPPRGAAATAGPAWIMVDIDHFKRVNDTHGHDGGDAVLKAVAAILKQEARDGDTLARLGGEEFVLLLPSVTEPMALMVGERLRRAVAGLSVTAGAQVVHVTASFGVTLQAPSENWVTAVERADVALYEAKQGGRDQVRLAAGG
jgi:diguanylate cyclase (GGDEF)-like protein/PAS domain S-box-containing protein